MVDERLDTINGMLEIVKRTTILAANSATRVAKHVYYETKARQDADPEGSYIRTNVDAELYDGLTFALAQTTQNLAVMWQITQAQNRERLFELGLISEKAPAIEASCSVDKDGRLKIGGSDC